jgi:PAS domain S-box-containing protein
MGNVPHSSKKIRILVLFLILIASIVVFNFLYVETQAAVKEATRDELRTLAAVVATQIDGDALSALRPGDESSPAFIAIRDQLYAMEQSNPDITYIYTMRRVNNTVQFIVDAEYGMDTPGDTASIGDTYPTPTAEMLQGFTENTVESEFATDQWGTTLSGYAPVRNAKGDVVGIVGVDMSADRVLNRMNFLGEILYLIILGALIGIGVGAIGFEFSRNRAEEELHDSERKMRAIFNNAYDGIFLHTPDGTIVDANDRVLQLYRVTRDEIPRLSLTKDLSAASNPLESLPRIWQEVMEGTTRLFEWRARRPNDGSEFDVEVHLSKITLEGRELIIANVRDITERKRAEDALVQVSAKLKLMNSVIRHDITNQLMIIRGYLILIREDQAGQSKDSYFERIEKASQTIQELITFSRDYQEIGVEAPRWQDLRETIQRSADQFPLPIPAIIVAIDGIEVYADLLLEKVFYNLIENAIRHGGPALKGIRFSCVPLDDGLTIFCEDDGEGIPDAEKELIFTRDYGKNTGLGLFLSREILSITGITIRETGVFGKGARFELHVPAVSIRQKEQ